MPTVMGIDSLASRHVTWSGLSSPLQHRQIPLDLKVRHVPPIVVVLDRLVLQQALEHVIAEHLPREVALAERLDCCGSAISLPSFMA